MWKWDFGYEEQKLGKFHAAEMNFKEMSGNVLD
jgi:hypothetical protein